MRRLVVFATVILMLSSAIEAQQQRGPSTVEERAQAVRLAWMLEANPLHAEAKDARQWLTVWLIAVPDISVAVCGSFMGPLLKSKKDFAPEIFSQSMYSTAAFVIEHPESKDDVEAKYLAGVEGSLRAYESLKKTNPKLDWPVLDDLIARRDAKTLAAYVHEKAPSCK
jgi:carboxypeptidase Q